GAFMSAGDYVQASRRRLEMIAAVEDALREVDVLLCASAMDPPSRIDDAAETERTYPRQARTPFNITGHPALAMMAGVSTGGLTLMPGIIDLHTHYDAQVTWDPTLSPSPSLGVTTAVMGNCGFGIVPSPPPLRDMIMRNLAVVEGMDLDALRAGIDWRFQSFAEYMTMLRGRGPYMNLGVLVGHSAVRTAVMGEDASVRKEPTAAELAEMRRLVAEAMDEGA